jgi:predicted DNA-binding transcriptional regulator AlpA
MDHREKCQFIDLQDLKEWIGFRSSTSIYNLIESAGLPKPIQIGRTRRWLKHEIAQWIASRVIESRGRS